MLTLKLELNLVEVFEAPDDLVPFCFQVLPFKGKLELAPQTERQKGAKAPGASQRPEKIA